MSQVEKQRAITVIQPNDWEQDQKVRQAINEVLSAYGDTVSVEAKAKSLYKFGRNRTVGTSWETVAEQQSTEANETFVSTNIIDSIVSSNAGDTQTITVEGHTIDASGNLTFVSQNIALTGQTPATLTTPLARATRAFVAPSGTFNSPPAALAGNVSVYDDTDGESSGVPTTASATKLLIIAGETQSEKAATSISQTDYWFIGYFAAGIGVSGGNAAIGVSGGNAARVTVRMETRDVPNGGVWRPMGVDVALVVGQPAPPVPFPALRIVPKNHDWRIVAKSDANTAEVFAEAGGVLAAVQS